jgi:hypothetical protein
MSTKTKSFYIATSLANWERHNQIRDALVAHGHIITHDWTAHSPWVKERSTGVSGAGAVANVDLIRQAGELDLKGVRDADILVVLLPGGAGTHAELGAGLVMGKRVLLVGTSDQIWGSGTDDYTCAFYHTSGVEHVVTDDMSADFLLSVIRGRFLEDEETTTVGAHELGLDRMAKAAFTNARLKGFWGDPTNPIEANVGEKMMLLVTEVAEAFEDWRAGGDLLTITTDADGKPGKPGGFPIELADLVIRVGDMAGRYGIPLDEAIAMKMAYNTGRPWMHGKRC